MIQSLQWFISSLNLFFFIPCKNTMIIQKYVQFFFKNVWKNYGLPTKLVSNKRCIFISTLLKTLWQQLNTQLPTSIIFDAQTNGQNFFLFIIGGRVALHEKQKQCKTWDGSFLYIHHSDNQEHPYNSLGKSMFEVCYGFHPLKSIDLINQLKSLNETTS